MTETQKCLYCGTGEASLVSKYHKLSKWKCEKCGSSFVTGMSINQPGDGMGPAGLDPLVAARKIK